MTQFHKALFRYANDAVRAAQQQAQGFKKELRDAQQRAVDAQAKLDLANSAIDRLDSFDPDIGGDLQCPDCWITRGVHSRLLPIPSDTEADLFRCETCRLTIEV